MRERLSKLSEASIRITEDLDLDIVLQGVVDGARSLTGARMGGITALDEQGQLQDFITSGLTPEEHQRFLELPGGPEFFAYLSMTPGPLRLADFSGHTTSADLPAIDPAVGSGGHLPGCAHPSPGASTSATSGSPRVSSSLSRTPTTLAPPREISTSMAGHSRE